MEKINRSTGYPSAFSRLPTVLASLLLVFLVAILIEGYTIYRLQETNKIISSPDTIPAADNLPVHLAFARAWYLESTGNFQDALRLYNELENRVDSPMREAIKYNMGTLYLNQAAKHWNSKGVWAYSEVITWTGLAERTFREILQNNPDHWDARYNLEYTLRLKPPPREVDKADWSGHKSSVHSVYPGIPGGSP